MSYNVKRCRYIVKSKCVEEDAMIFGRLHAVNETMVMDSVPYKVLAVIPVRKGRYTRGPARGVR